MQVIAINGSPRKNHNTAALLEQACRGAADQGAQTELIHLYDLKFRGCISCFACRRRAGGHPGRCALRDDLSPLLERILQEADLLFVGSPIYLHDVTGHLRCFMERLLFPNISYDEPRWQYPRSIASALFFTMNYTEEGASQLYRSLFESNSKIFACLNGATEYLASYDTWQFDDYSKYLAGRFDVAQKRRLHEEQFPRDCQKAYEIGARLAAGK